MTFEMILALGILVLMIVLIMTDKMAFGAPPILACLLLVVTGLSTVQEAFAGFVNPSVVMIAGFMVVMAAMQKTRLILILSLVSTIPYSHKLPTSKLMMPLGFATNHPLLPINVALFFGVTVTVLETAGFTEGVSMARFSIVNLFVSLAF